MACARYININLEALTYNKHKHTLYEIKFNY